MCLAIGLQIHILLYVTFSNIVSHMSSCNDDNAIQKVWWKIYLKRLTNLVYILVLFYKIVGTLSFLISTQTCKNIYMYISCDKSFIVHELYKYTEHHMHPNELITKV